MRGSLPALAADPHLDGPKGEIVVVIGPGQEAAASDDDVDKALTDALSRLSPGDAAREVAQALGVKRKAVYARALELKGR